MKVYFLILTAVVFMSCAKNNLESEVDKLLKDYSGEAVPGAAVMVVKDGDVLLQKGYGFADLENSIRITPSTNFRLASVTKQFTAMCIMLLEEKELLKYENTLTDIFPDFPQYGNEITITHLLQHTSGLVDYEELIPDTATIPVHDEDVLKMMMDVDSTYFAPGSKWQYSNSGYAVLAMIVEKISGLSFPEFLNKNIFTKLGMNNSVAFVKGVNKIVNRAFGYNKVDSTFEFSDQSLTSAVLGDGGIYTSLEDMFKWDQSLYLNPVVSSETLAKAFERGKLISGETIDYGFGWRRDVYKGIDRVYHPGSTCGFRNIYHRYHEQKLSVLILTNRREPDVAELANKIADLILE